MKRLSILVFSIFLVLGTSFTTAVHAKVKAVVDLSSQHMVVYVNGKKKYTWKISSGRKGYSTPTGSYRPQWLSKDHKSRKYNNAPMPYSVFYHGGFAVHGTNAVSRLGQPASHGCVRLSVENARKFYQLVSGYGKRNTRIIVKR